MVSLPVSWWEMTGFLLLACLRYNGFTSSSQGTHRKATKRRMVCTDPCPAYMGSSTAPKRVIGVIRGIRGVMMVSCRCN